MLDTNVIVAAMRSPAGAFAALLRAARQNSITPLGNVALALEYEATCFLAEHVLASGLGLPEVAIFVDAVIAMLEPAETHFMWRPQLRDPADELVLEPAVNGHAEAIVTFKCPYFGKASGRLGVAVLRARWICTAGARVMVNIITATISRSTQTRSFKMRFGRTKVSGLHTVTDARKAASATRKQYPTALLMLGICA